MQKNQIYLTVYLFWLDFEDDLGLASLGKVVVAVMRGIHFVNTVSGLIETTIFKFIQLNKLSYIYQG